MGEVKTVQDWIEKDGVKLYTKEWIPAGTILADVVFIHGFVEHIERYNHVFNEFAKQGLDVFAWDQRGFGQSNNGDKSLNGRTGGWPQVFSDIDMMVSRQKHKERPLFLFGHSMVSC